MGIIIAFLETTFLRRADVTTTPSAVASPSRGVCCLLYISLLLSVAKRHSIDLQKEALYSLSRPSKSDVCVCMQCTYVAPLKKAPEFFCLAISSI